MTPEQQRTATLERIRTAARDKIKNNQPLPSPTIWATAYTYDPRLAITPHIIGTIIAEEKAAIRQPSEAEGD